ncbi:SDR family NAD(P)-dependent oxidoreductase [Herbiconiux sp. KACC 21604]|uniref:SDR family NAD(P)-dependent oxidoreductase n=1 Tax=unclassified Herbiconiux TaxID=2618217 RepID=UPI0014913567|nr:SDR family NAD(P)-dependent oxidoreductase [Herbiconiux sp. SALV-R1]QJU52357.1 SDR family oxidoreductase [Herbiconiux sp. SALV-R1]WPO87213.1 SDR family NAD(P)-dependent oxidoreductase [Herbiconiux sp. KACC 21604]
MELTLEGKRALVTGSSSGIGRGIALRLAGEGATVIVHGRNADRSRGVADEITAAGGDAEVVTGDLTSAAETDALLDQVIAAGGADILINNAGGRAGGFSPEPVWETSADRWLATYQLNVLSAVAVTQRLVPGMLERGWGRVIHVASAVALHQPPAFADYQGAKAAEINFARSLARGLGGSGVTANSISVGIIATPDSESELQRAAATLGASDWRDVEKELATTVFRQQVPRIGRPDDIAWAVAYLASPRADFVTGTNIVIDAGI